MPTRSEPTPSADGLFRFADYDGPVRAKCDVLIVGSGPGGGLLAHSLAGSGLDVIVLEAGAPLGPQDFHEDIGMTIAEHFWEGGMRTTRGNVIMPTLQARALGGGSVFNAAICMRATKGALDAWAEVHGLGMLADGALDPHYEAVEKLLNVHPAAPEVQYRRNELFAEGCRTLGWNVDLMPRAETGCTGSARCILGCKTGAKESIDKKPIGGHLASGGRVYTSVHVERVLVEDGKVRGIVGHTVDPVTHAQVQPVRIMANTVVLSAGAINSPRIARASGLTAEPIGGNLRFHPSCYVLGVFDEDVDPWRGATQGVQTLEFLDQGIKIESLWSSPGTFAMRFPMTGKAFKRAMSRWRRTAVFDAWISGDDSVGRVGNLPQDRADIQWNLGRADARRLQEANALICDLYAAAGAKEIMHGLHGIPEILPASEAGAMIRAGEFEPHHHQTGSNHVFGTMAMGSDPLRHAIDTDGRVYGTDGLYVCDCSMFPGSPVVNPQHTAMALARRMAGHLVERLAPTA